jgi:DNA-directed RNA polymerase specialized sigma24 family protein
MEGYIGLLFIGAWLVAIAYNEIVNFIKRRKNDNDS